MPPNPIFKIKLQRQLILAEDGDTIRLAAGTFQLTGTLSSEEKNSIRIQGVGLDQTILSFKSQSEGAEGSRVRDAHRAGRFYGAGRQRRRHQDHLYDIVPGQPDQSILVYRIESRDPGEMMPELGRRRVHRKGVQLVREWIQTLPR